jgi:hypothetical protein
MWHLNLQPEEREMTDPVVTTVETDAKATAAAALAAATSVGAKLDSLIASAEAKAKADETALKTWIGKNWPHFLTWLGVAYPILKKFI